MDKNNIKLENNGTFITMRYELVPGEQIDDNVMERLNNNILEGVGKVQVTEVDSKKVIFSQIPVSVDLESYFKKTLTKPEVLTILKNLVAGFDIGKNGIPVGYIVKDFKYIYIDENTLNTYEFVVPIKGNTTDVSEIPEFFKKCVAGMKFHENDRDNYVAKIITKLNSDMFSLNDFNVMINEMLLEVGMSEIPAAGNMGSKVDKVGVLRNRAGQVPPMPQPGMGQPTPMPQPGMGQPTPMPQPGMGQIPPRPQQGMGQVPPMPQPGMGQIPPRPNQGMAQLSPIPQSGMAPVPPVPPQGMGQIPPMPQPVKRFDPMTGKPIEEPPASQPIPVAQPVKRFDPMTGKPIEEPKAEEPAPVEEPKIEESKAELPKTESPLTGPAPQPVPGPIPQPVPGPIPQPVPSSIPQPVQSSIPQPVPSSIPQPVQSSIPQPVPSSIPQPVPSSIPQPAPGPIPTPGPMPQPVKRFDPMTGKPIEEPKAEEPAPVEEPKAEAPAPVEEPKAEAPAPVEEPKAEAPAPTEEPKAEAPAPTEEPKTEAPAPAEEPKTEAPTEEPKTEEPAPAEEPKAEEPAPAEEPKAEEPVPTEEPEKNQDSNVNPGLGGVEELDELNLEDIDDELANSVKNIDPAPAPSNKPETKFDPMTGMPLSRSVQPMQSKPAPGPGPVPTPAPQPQQVNIVKPEAAQPPKQDVSKPHPHFVREKTGEKIYIDKDEFKIGKSKVHADYAIENNSAISRVHVIIIKRNGVSYLKDNDSTNGTFVDGARVNPGAEVLLKANMRVKFGNEDFTFLLRDEV